MTNTPAIRRLLMTLLLLWTGTVAALAAEAHVYIAPYGYASRFTGDGQVTGGSAGTDFDLEDTLGIDPHDTVTGLDGFLKFFGSRIDFGYNHGTYSGSERLSSTLVFNGTNYGAGERIRSEIDYTHYRIMYGFDFGLKVVNVGFLVGGHYVNAEASVKSSTAGRQQETLRAPVPAVGVSLGIHPIPQIAIHAQVSGFSVTVSDVKARLIDGFAGLHYFPIAKFGVVAGYRYFQLDAEDKDEDDRIDITQRGPYAGIALHF